jgi:hypothetical protein
VPRHFLELVCEGAVPASFQKKLDNAILGDEEFLSVDGDFSNQMISMRTEPLSRREREIFGI